MPRRRIGSLSASTQTSLEELTPELPDPAHWVGESLDRHDGRTRFGVDDLLVAVGNSLRVDPDDAMVDATLLDHQRPNFGIALEATRVGDLEAAGSDDIAAHEPGDRHLHASDVGFHVSFRSDEQVAIALDLAAEVAQQLAAILQLQPTRQCVVAA